MRISGKTGSVSGAQGPSGSKASPSSAVGASQSPATVSDALQVSSSARLVAVAQEVLAVTPDIRAEKVEALKNQMDADAYHPDGEAVAEGLIREHLAGGSNP
jgi:negative regulator of flagellin synthesis FlgM